MSILCKLLGHKIQVRAADGEDIKVICARCVYLLLYAKKISRTPAYRIAYDFVVVKPVNNDIPKKGKK